MTTVSAHTSTGRKARFGALAAVLIPVFFLINSTAGLVNQLGLPRGTATTIVNILVSAGPTVLLWIFPWLAPFIDAIMAALRMGTEAAISF